MMLIAAVVGSLSTYIGLLASYHYSTAAGASVVLSAVVIFFVVFAVVLVRDSMIARRSSEVPA